MKGLKYGVILLFLFALILFSCNRQIKFDKSKWQTKDDMEYSYRDNMLKDLTTNYKLSGLKYSEIINLLGQPQIEDSTSLAYQIIIKYGNDIDPVYTKYFNLTFSKDSIIKSFEIKEWKK